MKGCYMNLNRLLRATHIHDGHGGDDILSGQVKRHETLSSLALPNALVQCYDGTTGRHRHRRRCTHHHNSSMDMVDVKPETR